MIKDNISCLAPSFLPATAVLELTYKCNHKCIFCSCPWESKTGAIKKRKELSLDEWKKCIDTLTQMGICNISFTGGEPLLKENLMEIIEYASECKCKHIETIDGKLVIKIDRPNLFLLTNGLIMNDEILNLCREKNVHLSMSLPGLKTFKNHTKNGSPENILNWFSKANKMNINTTVNITVTKINFFELYETIASALIAGADTLLMNRFLPGGRGLSYLDELMLSNEEINESLDIAEEVLSTSNRFGSMGTELPICILKKNNYKHIKIGTKCSAAIDFFVVGPGGYIRVCNHSPVELAHISEIKILKNMPYWKTFIFKKYKPQYCMNCESLFICDAGCREASSIVHGSIDALDPQININ